MCNFFSFISDPTRPIPGRFMFFNWENRQKILSGELNLVNYEADSHTSIADFNGYIGALEDSLNKYEYNPLTGRFVIDQINNKVNDSVAAEKWVRSLDFTQVIAPLIIKPIIYPFKIPAPKITPEILKLLRKWDSVRASVGESVRDSIWESVWDPVWESVGESVWDSIWTSVGDSIWAYTSSFFNISYKFDTSSCVKLWELGLVPCFDGKTWRLHGGPEGKILWEGII